MSDHSCLDSETVTVIGDAGKVTVSRRILEFAIRSGWLPRVDNAFASKLENSQVCVFMLRQGSARHLAKTLAFNCALATGVCDLEWACQGQVECCIRATVAACCKGRVFLIFH